MLPVKRHSLICKWINEEGVLTLEELSKRLATSIMTVRRDLDLLTEQGQLKRIRGGAVPVDGVSETANQFQERSRLNANLKDRIAEYAAKHLIQDDDIIVMEGGTTIHAMIKHMACSNLTILTNSLSVVRDCSELPVHSIMGSGGTLDYNEEIFIGPQAASFFENFRAHKCFVGADGLTLKDGATEANLPEIEVKRAMIGCASQTILLLDSHKLGISSLVPAIRIDQIDIIITDKKAPKDIIKQLKAEGIQIHLV